MPKLEEIAVSPVQNLAAMHRGLKALDEQIAQAEMAFGLKAMHEQRAIKAVEYEQELARIAPGLQYGEDKFLMALKKKGESFREGNVKIIRSSRTTRAVLTEKFAATFPDLLAKVCKVELTKADALVGKKTMDEFVEKKTTWTMRHATFMLVRNVACLHHKSLAAVNKSKIVSRT